MSPAKISLHLVAVLNYLFAALTSQPKEEKTEKEQEEVKGVERGEVESLIVYDVVVIAMCALWIQMILILVSLVHSNCL